MTSQCLKIKADETLGGIQSRLVSGSRPTHCGRNQPASGAAHAPRMEQLLNFATLRSTAVAGACLKAVTPGRLTRGRALDRGPRGPAPGVRAELSVRASRLLVASGARTARSRRGRGRDAGPHPASPKAPPLLRKPVCPRGRAPGEWAGTLRRVPGCCAARARLTVAAAV